MSIVSGLQLKASPRFYHAYKKASPSLQGLAEHAIDDFINQYRSDRKTIKSKYSRLKGLAGNAAVIEIDLAGGPRMLAEYNGNRLVLLDMGDHDIPARYDVGKLYTDLSTIQEVPSAFLPEHRSEFFINNDDTTSSVYGNELQLEWLYFLDDQQQAVCDEIEYAVCFGKKQPHFILGGPGTGKTCILLNLLKRFIDEDFQVGISISSELASYISNALRVDINKYQINLAAHRPLNVLLIDDPQEIMPVLQRAKMYQTDVAVLAFDPLQLPDDFTDNQLETTEAEYEVCRHTLTTCYRQKENVGMATRHYINKVAESTPFLAEQKIETFRQDREKLTFLSNNLDFVNPNGYSKCYPAATVDDISGECLRIAEKEWLLWKHAPGLLVLSDGSKLASLATFVFTLKLPSNYVRQISFDQINEIKGLEFQHVFIFMEQTLFNEIQLGFKGSGQRAYQKRKLLRIPFSRAKDSLVIFSLDNPI